MGIALSFDTDWCDPEMVTWLQHELLTHGARATFFCTETRDKEAYEIRKPNEIAIHPSPLSNLFGTEIREHMSWLAKLYPEARGVRNHCLHQDTRLLSFAHENGFEYESNSLMFLVPGLRYWTRPSGLVSVPIYWEDDVYFSYEAGVTFDMGDLWLNAPGLKVLSFHPVHVWANTESQDDYALFKGSDIVSRKYGVGIRSLFMQFLRWWGPSCTTIGEAIARHKEG
jgi:hypothetical protein